MGAKRTTSIVIVTLDSHLASATERAQSNLNADGVDLTITLHAAAGWAADPESLQRCKADVASADIVVATMLFMEDHIRPILPTLAERQNDCDAMICCMSAAEVMRLTRMGKFAMNGEAKGPLALLRKLRGGKKKDDQSANTSGSKQVAMLRRLPKILRFIPGTAQDVRAYFLTLQYWLSGSDENLEHMTRYLAHRYAKGLEPSQRNVLKPKMPHEYPATGVYHPRAKLRIAQSLRELPKTNGKRGTVGVLVMRSYVLAGNTAHYDGVISALEARGLNVIPAFAHGLDAREAVDQFFLADGKPVVSAVLSLTGFSLVGGPAYNDARAAEKMLRQLDVPYFAAHALEFQSLESWQSSPQGLLPVEATMMVAIPELDGATGPMIFGARSDGAGTGDLQLVEERAESLADRVASWVDLKRSPRQNRRLAIVLFNFPPNSGATGTAAHLDVFGSLFNTLKSLDSAGYEVDVPVDVASLRSRLLEGNAAQYGADANVHHRISLDDHVRDEKWLEEIEAQWGPAPGREQTDGASLFVLGAQFGNVFVGIQPSFGYEGDPMRLLFESGMTPTHAFSAFYRYLHDTFDADAVLHFGTHGALEFMPGKQTALSGACWPDRLIRDLPNFYLYAANNPSEGMIAKRRSAATLISYLTPPLCDAGLYKELADLKASIDRFRSLPDSTSADERDRLAESIFTLAVALDLEEDGADWTDQADVAVYALLQRLNEMQQTLIPHGLHVLGQAPSDADQQSFMRALAEERGVVAEEHLQAIFAASDPDDETDAVIGELRAIRGHIVNNPELDGLIHALDAGFVPPAPGGDLLRNAEVLPTGRNIHGFDPFRLPSAFALKDGAQQAERLIQKHLDGGNPYPETIAIVLWGTDNLKSEGGPIAQALALLGARPRFDSYGKIAGAELIPLDELERPRIDVVMTLSGIFRDLLPHQTRLLAEAALLAGSADEPIEKNFARKHVLAYMSEHEVSLETAALRVFSNADGAYGSNVNHMVENGRWNEEDELAETYSRRKCFAYGSNGVPTRSPEVLQQVLSKVDLAYQNLESAEAGITTLDHYFDTLGGISRAVKRASGRDAQVYIGDQTRGAGQVRTLADQVALETRTRALNPKWYEGMLEHGYEGVRQIEAQITNTLGWSATTGKVDPWVYKQLTQTFMLDEHMRKRLATLNPQASVKVAQRLLEAHERQYWTPDSETLDALRNAGEELEDHVEGIGEVVAA